MKARSRFGRPSVTAKIDERWHQYWIGLADEPLVHEGAPARQALRDELSVPSSRMAVSMLTFCGVASLERCSVMLPL